MGNDAGAVIRVEVVYARPGRVWRRQVELQAGATAEQALRASELLGEHPEFGDTLPPLGIFGRACTPRQVLQNGDRLEVYRPLVFDPMESRRRRARHRQRKGQRKGTLSGT